MTDKFMAPGLPSPVMVLRSEKYEQQELAREMAARNADPLSEAKRPGGFYLRADGTPVNSEDVEIPESDLTADEKESVRVVKSNTKEALAAEAAANKEKARLAVEVAKVQKKADEANKVATQTAVEVGWAKTRAAAGVPAPRKGGVGSGPKTAPSKPGKK